MNRALILVSVSVATAVVLAASRVYALPSCCQQDGEGALHKGLHTPTVLGVSNS